MKNDLVTNFNQARLASVPIVSIDTADQFATVQTLIAATDARHPIVQWEAVEGMSALNPVGEKALQKAGIASGPMGFTDAMVAALKLPELTLLIAHNVQRQLVSMEPNAIAAPVQAVANLRDKFTANHRMLVLLGPRVPLPLELESDVVVLYHELPDDAALEKVVREVLADPIERKVIPTQSDDAIRKTVDAVSGLSAFAAEQVTAMSIDANGINLDYVWERKRVAIEQTPGLTVWRGGEKFDDLIGLDNIKSHLRRRLNAKTPIGVVVFIDEIDKALANVEHDTSGVRMDQLRTLLTEMENNRWRGLVAVGVPGAGKSAIGKALGNEAGVPTAALDFGAMESKYVGESEAYIRRVMSVIKAIGRGHAYVIATSNNATVMRPELQRRFTDGMWMFDLMSEAERTAALAFYIAKYGLTKAQTAKLPDMDGWTGAEIRNLCEYAWDTNSTLVEAAQFIVPMARSRVHEIEALRQYAEGRLLDANKPGAYRHTDMLIKQKKAVRAISVDDTLRPLTKGES